MDLKDALLGTAVLESIHKRGLDSEEGPMSIGGRGGGWRGTVDDAIVAALDGRAIDGEIEGRHLEGLEDVKSKETEADGSWMTEVGDWVSGYWVLGGDVDTVAAAVAGAGAQCL